MKEKIKDIVRNVKGIICDMDGVVYHGNQLLPGVAEFIDWMERENINFLFLTNASNRSPRELKEKLQRMGLEIPEENFYTSALATARFLESQAPNSSAYVIGDPGLINALYESGITMNDVNPDYVVVGDTANYNYENIFKAVQFVNAGAKLIGTCPDITGPIEGGLMAPSGKALVAPIEVATGKNAYFVGKPNPLMVRTGLRMLDVHSEEALFIGDRMDTDIISGIESGMHTLLVLSGVTRLQDIKMFPYRPDIVAEGIGELMEIIKQMNEED